MKMKKQLSDFRSDFEEQVSASAVTWEITRAKVNLNELNCVKSFRHYTSMYRTFPSHKPISKTLQLD